MHIMFIHIGHKIAVLTNRMLLGLKVTSYPSMLLIIINESFFPQNFAEMWPHLKEPQIASEL